MIKSWPPSFVIIIAVVRRDRTASGADGMELSKARLPAGLLASRPQTACGILMRRHASCKVPQSAGSFVVMGLSRIERIQADQPKRRCMRNMARSTLNAKSNSHLDRKRKISSMSKRQHTAHVIIGILAAKHPRTLAAGSHVLPTKGKIGLTVPGTDEWQ